MGIYLAMQIMKGRLDYKAVVTKYPQYKVTIDEVLTLEGRSDLIIE